jgi:hypothetical protein
MDVTVPLEWAYIESTFSANVALRLREDQILHWKESKMLVKKQTLFYFKAILTLCFHVKESVFEEHGNT